MAYDADAAVAALRPPAFKAGGRTYRGRLLSVEEVIEISTLRVHLEAANPAGSVPASRAYAREVVARWFPRRWWQLGNPAVRAFMRLPDPVQIALLTDFSRSQRSAMPRPPGTDTGDEPEGMTTT